MKSLSDDGMKRLGALIDQPDLTGTPYRLIGRVASGGMGTIFEVEDEKLRRRVALKVLTLPDDDGQMVARMEREAQIMAQLEHPTIVPIHDVGKLLDGRLFYTMKFVEGVTMRQHLSEKQSRNDLLRLFEQACQAVAFAHSRQVIHRDIKPDNIMIGPFGEVLVMDWGVARSLDVSGNKKLNHPSGKQTDEGSKNRSSIDGRDTVDGTVIGTPGFMSPEQACGETGVINERSDIYALGATLYYILTLQEPGGSKSLSPATSTREIDKTISRQLDAICKKAMEPDPVDRYSSVVDLAADIQRYLAGEPVKAYRENPVERLNRWLSKNQLLVYIVLAYIALRILIFIFLKR